MQHDKTTAHTFDCPPTLNDAQVLQFCREGYILLPGIVPEDTNRRTCDWLEGKIDAEPSYMPDGLSTADLERIRSSHEPSSIFIEEWFRRDVLLNEHLVGIMRSLLGAHVGLPVLASHHGTQCPQPAQGWHHDADRVFGPELHFVEVFYFPQDTPVELGPTELVPGSHIGPATRAAEESGVFANGPAGTLGIHHQSILHRRGASTASGTRHMLKYNYWRTTSPQRDWIRESDFDLRTTQYGSHEQARYTAHMFYWLCGRAEAFRTLGGQAWPWRSANQIGPSYGFEPAEGYLPDWRRKNPDGYAR
ncbi:MAG: phytanoyl-CoA dioxygenase family protein [Candidatus Latescibacterota bacterium]|jgi:hypothetical protein